MINLSDREWKAFFISGKDGIFSIKATKSGIDKNKLIDGDDNCVPYITRSDIANGMHMFISEEQRPKYSKDAGNCITIGLDTQTVFYQPHSFYTGQNIQVLNYDGMTKYSALFIASMLKVQMKKFNWGGNGATLGRLSRTKVMLPVNHKGEPDYDFMERYIKERELMKRVDYIEFAKTQLAHIERERVNSAVKWLEFRIEDLFEIKSGKRLVKSDIEYGDRPFIGASDSNNGITAWCSNMNNTLDSNVLGVNYNGSVVENFYHPYECIFSDDVKRFHLKNTNGDKYLYLFIKTALIKQKNKYRYAYKFNGKRMNRQTIMLPAIGNKPNYVYMSNYIKNVFADKYTEYLDYAQKTA